MSDIKQITQSAELHRCEVLSVVRMYYPDNKRAVEYFAEVEKRRGKDAAERLRADVRVEWMARQAGEKNLAGRDCVSESNHRATRGASS